jgi:predicted DNA-binding antitoxin AbrB/MazE fold protein
MAQRMKAVYRGGAFVPLGACDLPEGSEVDLTIHRSRVIEPSVTEAAERQRILRTLIQRMQANPLPLGAPQLNRETLHERG